MMPVEVPEPVQDIGQSAGLLAAVLGLIGLIWTMTGGRRWWSERRANRDFQHQFRTDWNGEPARPGVVARQGVMSSLEEIRNDGTSLARRVHRVEQDLLKIRSELTFLMSHNRHTATGQRRDDPSTEEQQT